jgi:hypothetical protein
MTGGEPDKKKKQVDNAPLYGDIPITGSMYVDS